MYPKTVTQEIVKAWAKGASAEETVTYLQTEIGVHVCLNTIYKKRKSLEAQEMIDELLRQQLREIVSADDKELKLKYRNELLKIFMPIRQEILSKNITVNKTELTMNVTTDLLKQYEDLFKEATLLEHCTPQPLHTQTTPPSNGQDRTNQ